jgi:hypothetical protein
MKVTGKIINATVGLKSQKGELLLQVNELQDFKDLVDQYNAKEKLSIEIKQYRKRRSLDANAYCWVLIGEIANELRATKDEIYLDMLKKYGQQFIVKIKNKDKERFERTQKYWEVHETLTDGKAQYYRLFIGSSEYDSHEMSILIDGIISEAIQMGIQVETPNKIAEMKSRWGA